MAFDPRFVRGTERVEDGWRLEVRCPACGRTASVVIRHSDPVGSSHPLPCSCGVYVATGEGRSGKDLLDAIREASPVPEDLERRAPPSAN